MRKAIGASLLTGMLCASGLPVEAAEKKDFLDFFKKSENTETGTEAPAEAKASTPPKNNGLAPKQAKRPEVSRAGAAPASRVRYSNLPPTRSFPVPRDPNRSLIRVPQPPPPPPLDAPDTEYLQKPEKKKLRSQ